jgi:hypothetical protein
VGASEPSAATADGLAASVVGLMDDLLDSYSERAAAMVERAGELASDLARAAGGVLGALLGGAGAPESVEEMIEQLGGLMGRLAQALGALLLGGGHSAPAGQLIEGVADVVGDLAQTVGALLGGLLGEGGAPDPASNRVAQLAAFLYARTADMVERDAELMGRMVRTADEALGGEVPNQAGEPIAPPVAPLPAVPVAPGGSAPVGYSFFLSASGSSADAFQPLFAVLVLFSIALLQGGKSSWQRRNPLRPSSALRLAVERPG